jgi:VIT1/CCC1 family predicted Fe2+/Mn2+ transporter
VVGANDGLTSNLALIMGVAGAQLANRAILITGLTGLLAGACSMVIGEAHRRGDRRVKESSGHSLG